MKKGNFDNIKAIYFSYDRGFISGYLSAKLGVNWPDIPKEERKPYEDEARKTLEIWNEICEGGVCKEEKNEETDISMACSTREI